MLLRLGLSLGIVFVVSFAAMWLRRFFFVNPVPGVPSNSKKAMAFLLDMLVFHVVLGLGFTVTVFLNADLQEGLTQWVAEVTEVSNKRLPSDIVWLETRVLLVYLGYATLLELTPLRGTLGMHYLDLKVSGENGKNPQFWQIILRNLFKSISLIAWPVLMFQAWMNPRRRWLHDVLSGCLVKDLGMERR